MKKKVLTNERPVLVLKSGQKLCKNTLCRAVFTPEKFGQDYCCKSCEAVGSKKHLRGFAARHAKVAIFLLITLAAGCRPANMHSVRLEIGEIKASVSAVQAEQEIISQKQAVLFLNYRQLHVEYIALGILDSLEMKTEAVMLMRDIRQRQDSITSAMLQLVDAMQKMSDINADLQFLLYDLYNIIDEIEAKKSSHDTQGKEEAV